ncbi:MAG TPA: twin-arginine translocase subunit TatC [Verrucomicrobiae bacterium]|nr:twin-arginine translocase subunit TatC [Verrucomicrobiae bacterium]
MTLIQHLAELRRVLVVSAFAIVVGTIAGFAVSEHMFGYLTKPVASLAGTKFVTTSITEPIMVKLKVSVMAGILLALPVIAWQIWSFVLPALKKNERKYVYIIVPFSVLLFLGGAAFAFYMVMPVGIKVLLFVNSGVVYEPLITQSSYLSFLLTFLLSFGAVFELPVVLLLLVRMGIITPRWLGKNRRYALFAIVVIAAFVSPTPDIPSLLLMSGPMYLLYEASIWLSYLVTRRRQKAIEKV